MVNLNNATDKHIASTIGIVPFTYFGGFNKSAGSTFLRVEGLIANADGFEVWRHGRQYRGLIFQKAYWLEMMEIFQGPKILDLCDVDWISGNIDIIEVGSRVDAITCSSPGLTDLIKGYFPKKIVTHVPDRLNFKIFPLTQKNHSKTARNVLWFGYIQNAYQTLPQLAETINQLDLKLTIVSDQPYQENDAILNLKPAFIKYEKETAYNIIQQTDIVLNPRSETALYKYKSNNKSVIAWKLGLPVAETASDIYRFLDPEARSTEVCGRQVMVNEGYDIRQSANDYEKIFALINLNKEY